MRIPLSADPMRLLRASAFLVLFLAWLSGPSAALERTAVPLDGPGPDGDWAAGTTCTVSYFNRCTGWLWLWDGWSDGDVIGMTVDPCCGPSHSTTLIATNQYAWTGSCVPGRGFTGLISIQQIDQNGCPTAVLAEQPFIPCSGDNVVPWNLSISEPFAVTVEHRTDITPLPTRWATDHPSAGPTGPQACGLCYPVDRVTHSFYFGRPQTPLCPGSPFFDPTCNAELLGWSAAFACPANAESRSWGTIKALYR